MAFDVEKTKGGMSLILWSKQWFSCEQIGKTLGQKKQKKFF